MKLNSAGRILTEKLENQTFLTKSVGIVFMLIYWNSDLSILLQPSEEDEMYNQKQPLIIADPHVIRPSNVILSDFQSRKL